MLVPIIWLVEQEHMCYVACSWVKSPRTDQALNHRPFTSMFNIWKMQNSSKCHIFWYEGVVVKSMSPKCVAFSFGI